MTENVCGDAYAHTGLRSEIPRGTVKAFHGVLVTAPTVQLASLGVLVLMKLRPHGSALAVDIVAAYVEYDAHRDGTTATAACLRGRWLVNTMRQVNKKRTGRVHIELFVELMTWCRIVSGKEQGC